MALCLSALSLAACGVQWTTYVDGLNKEMGTDTIRCGINCRAHTHVRAVLVRAQAHAPARPPARTHARTHARARKYTHAHNHTRAHAPAGTNTHTHKKTRTHTHTPTHLPVRATYAA